MDAKEKDLIKKTREYIVSRWPLAIHRPENEPQSDYMLPYPFVPPCISGDFHVHVSFPLT